MCMTNEKDAAYRSAPRPAMIAAAPPPPADEWNNAIDAVLSKLHEYGCPSGILAKIDKMRKTLPPPPGTEGGV